MSTSFSQEIGFDAGINKVGYTPFYRTFSENYEASFQSDIAWQAFNSNDHSILFGVAIQFNFQSVIGERLNLIPILSYRFSFYDDFFAEFQTGLGFQLLLPSRTLYEQTDSGDWIKSNNLLINQILPLQIGFGRRFNSHSLQLNYSYQLIFGFNPSISSLPIERWSLGYKFNLDSLK
jgi:hypothetical protein